VGNRIINVDFEAAYDALSQNYAQSLAQSMRIVWDRHYFKIHSGVPPAKPTLAKIHDKLQLECRATSIRQGRLPVQGFKLQCFAQIKADARGLYLIREEIVLPTTTIKEQREIMDAMCDIVAVQAQCDYKLRSPHRVVAPQKTIQRPSKGRY
jgi:hypothetical protein